jgi:putative two-component system response regulator
MVKESQLREAQILIIDDEEISVRLLEETLRKAGYRNITTTNDPQRGITMYRQLKPALVVLDLNMPHTDGFEVMKHLKEIEQGNYLPVIVLSHEENQEIKFKALESGAKDFLNKPYDRIEVVKRIQNLIEVRMLHTEIRNQNKLLEDKVKERTQELYDTQLDVIQRLARAIEYRDSETGLHIVRMSHYASCLAAKAGLSLSDCELILTASPLHDIGKIGIPDSILRKPGRLTPEEWAIMKTHTTIGGELLSGSKSKFLMMAKEIALTHHERWDGSGYPQGLKGEEIPMVGRICGLSDVFDALLSQRPYKRAWGFDETLEEIKKGSGFHFDPKLVDSFLDILPQVMQIREKYLDPVEA